jgi:CBS domain-containing protein
MTPVTAVVGPEHTLRQAAERMVSNGTGAAVVVDPSLPGPGVITERDLLRALGAGLDPGAETVGEHMSGTLLTAAPGWSLEQAASLMIRHNIRHVLVFDGDELAGVLSMRDVLKNGGIAVPRSDAGTVTAAA